MPRILAWQCPHTGKLFQHEPEYRAHLHDLALDRARRRRAKARRDQFDATVRAFQMSCFSFMDVAQWVEANPEVMFAWNHHSARPRVRDVEFINLRWDARCSNSHNAPKGKSANWSREPGKPLYYPGWNGKMRFGFDTAFSFESENFRRVGLHLGGGGSGNGRTYSYELTVFEEEFPNIAFKMRMEGKISSDQLRR